MKRIAIALIALSGLSAQAAQPKHKAAPKAQQCSVDVPVTGKAGKSQTIIVDCGAAQVIAYLQEEITHLTETKQDQKPDQDITTALLPKRGRKGRI